MRVILFLGLLLIVYAINPTILSNDIYPLLVSACIYGFLGDLVDIAAKIG